LIIALTQIRHNLATLINPLVPSVPKNGTPILTVSREIIQALIGYTTVSTYSTFNMSHYN